MKVTVFGGAQPKPGEPAYEQAYQLGKMLGADGHTVLTGGYIGTMEAVSRGASETGGHVIGVTCEEIEKWRLVGPNAYVMEQMRFPTLSARLMALIFNCDAAVALPGGVGTLAEIAMFWNHLIIEAFPPRPIILVGNGWRQVYGSFLEGLGSYVSENHQKLLTCVDDEQAAMAEVRKAFAGLS